MGGKNSGGSEERLSSRSEQRHGKPHRAIRQDRHDSEGPERCGYTRGAGQRRYKRPRGSTAHEPTESVTIFENRFSYHHSSNDILNDKKAHDAFDIICTHEHGGNYKEAVKAVARELGIAHPTSGGSLTATLSTSPGRGVLNTDSTTTPPPAPTNPPSTSSEAPPADEATTARPRPENREGRGPQADGDADSLDRAGIDPLPDEAIIGALGEMIYAAASNSETPPELALCVTLGVISTACAARTKSKPTPALRTSLCCGRAPRWNRGTANQRHGGNDPAID